MAAKSTLLRRLEEYEKNQVALLDKNEELCEKIRMLERCLGTKQLAGNSHKIRFERLVMELDRLVKRYLTELN